MAPVLFHVRIPFQELDDTLCRALAGGQRVLDTRRENMSKGVPVDPDVWRFVQTIAGHG